MSREDPHIIDSVAKALAVLECFSHEHPRLTVSQAAELTGFTRPTARRILLTFERLGFAESDGRSFALTPRILRLGYSFLASVPIVERAQPRMRALADAVRESCSLAALDGGDIVYLARVPGSRTMSITLAVGSRLPAYPTSMGRVLLAALTPAELDAYLDATPLVALTPRTITDRGKLVRELDRVRRQGYAVIDGEREEGVRSAAAPVRDAGGAVVAALNVSANAARVSVADLREQFVPELVATARAISVDAGYAPE